MSVNQTPSTNLCGPGAARTTKDPMCILRVHTQGVISAARTSVLSGSIERRLSSTTYLYLREVHSLEWQQGLTWTHSPFSLSSQGVMELNRPCKEMGQCQRRQGHILTSSVCTFPKLLFSLPFKSTNSSSYQKSSETEMGCP